MIVLISKGNYGTFRKSLSWKREKKVWSMSSDLHLGETPGVGAVYKNRPHQNSWGGGSCSQIRKVNQAEIGHPFQRRNVFKYGEGGRPVGGGGGGGWGPLRLAGGMGVAPT